MKALTLIIGVAIEAFLIVKAVQINKVFKANSDITPSKSIRPVPAFMCVMIGFVAFMALLGIFTGSKERGLRDMAVSGALLMTCGQIIHNNVIKKFEELRVIYSKEGEEVQRGLAAEKENTGREMKKLLMAMLIIFAVMIALSMINILMNR